MSVIADEQNALDNPSSGFDSLELKSCHCCGRTFNPKSLERHEKICEKTNKTIRRAPFNSYLQRAKELAAIPVVPEQKEKEKKLKENHSHSTKSTPTVQKKLNNGASPCKLPPSGYEQCTSCDRFFSPKAADRHISWCREQKSRLPKTPPDTQALERLKARTKYRAPLPIKKWADSPNQRLIRSADSIRESISSSSSRETYSSPLKLKQKSSLSQSSNNNYFDEFNTKNNGLDSKPKKVVKFKEMFPVDNKSADNIDRNKNLDMLAALRLHLSELSASDDFLEDYILRSGKNTLLYDKSGPFPTIQRSRFCYNCGTKYPVANAKFCCECGVQRLDPIM
ncbi:hypothetical protein JTE90_000903 [Oedothorax gibbosus]|uniref:C2HC/C3H-type domain-containing protein n=1 Tax=Oedothorax gibbosus TaxID=931172 RepID=A0AAV6VWG1_9ARAC|nr:hypothetical protein JTE90_000903 [Oedothorax gibbosus]